MSITGKETGNPSKRKENREERKGEGERRRGECRIKDHI